MKNIHSVVLAAGLSRRMNSRRTNKVCLELLGKPVIVRVLEALAECGISSHSAVIGGESAGEVMRLLSGRFKNISYACQPRQLGPADALNCAVKALPETIDNNTLLLVVPGHRIVAAEIIEKLLEFYNQHHLKLAGLQLFDENGLLKQTLSIYLGRVGDIRCGLEKLYLQEDFSEENEVQLDKLAALMNPPEELCYMPVTDFSQVIGFNNPEEFLLAADLLQQKAGKSSSAPDPEEYHPVSEWLAALNTPGSALQLKIQTLYGSDNSVMLRQRERLQKLLECAQSRWHSDTLISVIRSPGRVNIMGRHVDHQGGNCNLMTIGCETLMAVKLRDDDHVTLCNLDKEFAPAEFSIGELVRDLPWDDWQALVESKKLARLLKQYGVNWADYIKAVFLRFQKHFDHKKLHGMDMIVSGNVPMAAGLSSSSTLVVGTAEAVVGANRLDLEPDKLVTLCGEGEWFVGTRGGAADHAAVKLGECNKVVKVKFFDFAIEKLVNFPTDYTLIVCDSKIQARKSGNAKDQFNHRVSCYRIGLLLLKKFFPQYAANLHHLRDFTCEKLNIPLDWFYKLLSCLPEYATRSELEKMLPEADLQQFWNNHNPPADGLYPIRGVVLYGLAECARAARFVDCLENNISEVGEMMNISHNGDRVKRFDRCGNLLGDYRYDVSDAALQKLISNVQSGDPARIAGAELWRQPGSYRCSLPEIDLMADLANSVDGAVGSQLAGAGLGGCMMVLIHNRSVEELSAVLYEKYYKPRNLQAELLHCRPIAGACAIKY